MNKADLVSALAEKTGATKKAAEASLDRFNRNNHRCFKER